MRSSFIKYGLLLGLSLLSQYALAGQGWEMVSDKDGIKVYRKEIPGSDLIAFKGVKLMPAPIAKVAQVLLDPDEGKKKQWVDMIKEFKVLEAGEMENVCYSSYDLPWPLADRDYVIKSKMTIDNEGNQILIDLRSTEHPDAPKTIGVRALLAKSLYRLVPKPGRTTEVTVEIQTDPKGELPKWLVNIIQRGWPAKTLSKMEIQALSPDTKESELIKAQFKGAQEFAKR